MTTSEILTWIFQSVLALGLLYLAFRKAPGERTSSDAAAAKAYGEAAQISGEEALRLKQLLAKQEQRIAVLERKKYQITMDFTIGDPPSIGVVNIKPILPDDTITVQRSPRKKT
jgi:hypothetical protein